MIEDGWITKREAATLAAVDERTIERKARAGKITSKGRPGFPTLYLASDVEQLRQAGSQEVRTGILEAGPAGNGNGHGSLIETRPGDAIRRSEADDPIRQLAALVVQALTHRPEGPIGPTGPTIAPTGPTAPPDWMTVAAVADAWGWPRADVRALMADGKLGEQFTVGKGRRARVLLRRRAVEAFAAGRTEAL